MVQLLHNVPGPLLDAALKASPERTGDLVYNLLAAAAASWCGPQERPRLYAWETVFFAARTFDGYCRGQLGLMFTDQMMRRVGRIKGLPAVLADFVGYIASPSLEERQIVSEKSKLEFTALLLWMLRLALKSTGDQQCLTPQQLETMQLLPLLRQHPFHGATLLDSMFLSDLHAEGVAVVLQIAARRGGDQLPLRYWAATGVHQLQVSPAPGLVNVLCWLLACAPSSC